MVGRCWQRKPEIWTFFFFIVRNLYCRKNCPDGWVWFGYWRTIHIVDIDRWNVILLQYRKRYRIKGKSNIYRWLDLVYLNPAGGREEMLFRICWSCWFLRSSVTEESPNLALSLVVHESEVPEWLVKSFMIHLSYNLYLIHYILGHPI